MLKILAGLALALALVPGTLISDQENRRKAVEHQRTGETLLRGEKFEEAAEEFRQAIALDPLLVIAHFNLGQAYMALKRYPEAVTAYTACEEAILRLSSVGQKEREERDRANEDEIRELRRSIVQIQTGQMKGASVDASVLKIEERIRILENSRMRGREAVQVPAEVHLGLGSAYFRQNKLEEAEKNYVDAVRTNKKLGAAHNNLAVIYMLSGRLPQAHASMLDAEKAGFAVDARFKADLAAREKAAGK